METSRIDEELNQWLRDAHAMEEQAETMLKAQASRIGNRSSRPALSGISPRPAGSGSI